MCWYSACTRAKSRMVFAFMRVEPFVLLRGVSPPPWPPVEGRAVAGSSSSPSPSSSDTGLTKMPAASNLAITSAGMGTLLTAEPGPSVSPETAPLGAPVPKGEDEDVSITGVGALCADSAASSPYSAPPPVGGGSTRSALGALGGRADALTGVVGAGAGLRGAASPGPWKEPSLSPPPGDPGALGWPSEPASPRAVGVVARAVAALKCCCCCCCSRFRRARLCALSGSKVTAVVFSSGAAAPASESPSESAPPSAWSVAAASPRRSCVRTLMSTLVKSLK
mmetsp:Transcript_4163/g.12193  ORF Transcript_4163/g.12193 Transcript_4163/m.12193 type:complete len:280 (+) Transcript_4163:965-1804(+)